MKRLPGEENIRAYYAVSIRTVHTNHIHNISESLINSDKFRYLCGRNPAS